MRDLLICTGELAAGGLVVIASTESRSVAAMLQWQGIPVAPLRPGRPQLRDNFREPWDTGGGKALQLMSP
jgi:hypothetical protein